MHKESCRFAPASIKVHEYGLSLVELLVVVSLLSLTVGAVSGYGQWVDNSRIETKAMELRTALNMARSEAITRAGRVAICRRDNDILQQCAGNAASGKPDWSNGWLMYWDVDQDRQLNTDKGDLVLRVFPSSHPSMKIRWNKGDYVAFQASGLLHSGPGTFCIGMDNGTDSQREVVLRYTGRARISSGECSYAFATL